MGCCSLLDGFELGILSGCARLIGDSVGLVRIQYAVFAISGNTNVTPLIDFSLVDVTVFGAYNISGVAG